MTPDRLTKIEKESYHTGRWLGIDEVFEAERHRRDGARRPEPVAHLECGFSNNRGQPCPERFFTTEGRDDHYQESHNPRPRRMWYDE